MKEDKKTKMKFNKMTVLTCLMIGLCFLWTGSAYIAWGRRIGFFYDERTYYLLTEAWGGYLPQIAGLVTFAFLIFKKPDIVFSYLFPVTVCILDGLLLVGCLLIPEGDLIITCGIIMNYFHGIVSGFYLAFLAMAVPKCHRGLTFGIGYAIGSIGTYLMSLPGNGNYLVQKSATVVYIALIALTALLLRSLLAVSQERIIRTSDAIRSNHITGADRTWLCRMLLFPAILIFLVTLLNQLIYVFPASAYLNGKISLEFSRAFYAVGLLIAGYLNDLDRRFGPLLCLLAFIFSLLSLGLYNESNATLFLAIMGFISLAFPIVYRVVAFLDTSDKKYIFLCISPMGLAIGRLGEAIGAHLGLLLADSHIGLIVSTCILFILIAVLTCYIYAFQSSSQIRLNEDGATTPPLCRKRCPLKSFTIYPTANGKFSLFSSKKQRILKLQQNSLYPKTP